MWCSKTERGTREGGKTFTRDDFVGCLQNWGEREHRLARASFVPLPLLMMLLSPFAVAAATAIVSHFGVYSREKIGERKHWLKVFLVVNNIDQLLQGFHQILRKLYVLVRFKWGERERWQMEGNKEEWKQCGGNTVHKLVRFSKNIFPNDFNVIEKGNIFLIAKR